MAETSYLPTDLCREIFSRLPVKSLLRFRSVSKTWHSIIHDPEFVKSHKYRPPESKISVIRSVCYDFEYSMRDNKTFQVTAKNETLRIKDMFLPELLPGQSWRSLLPDRQMWRVLGSSDGLFVFETWIDPSRRRFPGILIIWNPSIRRFSEIPSAPEKNTTVDLGFGFDPSTRDYKLVRCVLNKEEAHSVLVYNLGTNSWEATRVQDNNKKKNRSWCFKSHEPQKSVCFRGGLYFLARETRSKRETVVSYNFKTREFSTAELPPPELLLALPYPFEHNDNFRTWDLKCASDGSLALVETMSHNSWSIWWGQGEGGHVTWSKRYTFDFLSRRYYGNVCSEVLNSSLDFGTSSVLREVRGSVRLCNLETNEEEIVFKDSLSSQIVHVCPYVESLVFLKK